MNAEHLKWIEIIDNTNIMNTTDAVNMTTKFSWHAGRMFSATPPLHVTIYFPKLCIALSWPQSCQVISVIMTRGSRSCYHWNSVRHILLWAPFHNPAETSYITVGTVKTLTEARKPRLYNFYIKYCVNEIHWHHIFFEMDIFYSNIVHRIKYHYV